LGGEEEVKMDQELEILIDLMDEEEEVFDQRITYMMSGQPLKARYVDNHILPGARRDVIWQLEKVEMMSKIIGGKHGRQKE